MTAVVFSRLFEGRGAHHVHGWTVSMLCHMFGIGGVLLFMAEIEKPVLPNTFQWEVAMVEAHPTIEPASAPVQPTPVPQRQVERLIDPRPRVETVETVQHTVRDVVTPVETVEAVTAEAVMERSAAQTSDSSKVVSQTVAANYEPVVEQTALKSVSHATVERAEAVAEPTTVAHTPDIRQAERVERESPRSNSQSAETEHRVVRHRVVKVRQTQADYGWLRDALWARIVELKRYPVQAKNNHWEGKVVVEVVIREDGTVVSLQVAESSGRAILDQEAMEAVKRASPLTLKHPLGQPSVTLLVPISYKLDG